MALPTKLKSLIDKYCMGVTPSDSQMDEILNMAVDLSADSAEVSAYMQEMIAGPTREERKAMEEAEKKKAAAAAKRKAALKAKKEAERKAQIEREKREAERKAREAEEREKRKRKRRILSIVSSAIICVALFGLVHFTTNSGEDNNIETKVEGGFNIEELQNLLVSIYGDEYTFDISTPKKGTVKVGDMDVILDIKASDKDAVIVGEYSVAYSPDDGPHVYKLASYTSELSTKMYKSISDWAKSNIK